jgi:colanic acid/amylovoran biosynthesis glycosyltransferase
MPLPLAYLISQYPAANHTYILREIRTLRSQGFEIESFSIRAPDRPLNRLTPVEREEADATWTVLCLSKAALLKAQLTVLFSSPRSYARGLWAAVTLGHLNLPAIFQNLIYFSEAVVIGLRMQNRGLTHLHSHFTSSVALFVTKVFPITFSATIHGSAEFENTVGFYLPEKVETASFLCTISQYGRSQLMRVSSPEHWRKIEVSPLGVDLDLFAPRPHRPAPDCFEILSVGQLSPAKGYQILIEAISQLVMQGHTNIRLRIAGGGSLAESLKRQITLLSLEKHVLLEGLCNQDRVRQLYQETDLFALASFAEGVPVVLMEAMAMEIPCLATGITGIPELIRHEKDGWLVPPSDSEELAKAIALLMANPNLRQQLGKAGRLRVQERYHLATNTTRLGHIFRQRLPQSAQEV